MDQEELCMQSFFNGVSGMFNFSKLLDNVSNNISNMNTPGYKGNDMFIRSLGDGDESRGATITSSSMRTEAGDLRQTANNTDLAINGEGYFVLKNKDGELFYTRAGQFKLDPDFKLIDSSSEFSVMGINASGQLEAINISEHQLLPPKATTEISLVGNLNSSDSTYTASNISVFDAGGTTHILSAVFTKSTDNTWDVVINNSDTKQLASFQIQFGIDSSPADGFNSFTKSIFFGNSTQDIKFTIGSTGSLSGVTQLSGTSNLSASAKDGHNAIGLKSFSVDDKGIFQFTYSDSEKTSGQQIALTSFADTSVLEASSSGLYKSNALALPKFGRPNSDIYGTIQSKSIEMSNVDLTQEFADILILQRGYQASSRVMSVSNDLLEQLFNNTRTK